jgi:hypothetical protein
MDPDDTPFSTKGLLLSALVTQPVGVRVCFEAALLGILSLRKAPAQPLGVGRSESNNGFEKLRTSAPRASRMGSRPQPRTWRDQVAAEML